MRKISYKYLILIVMLVVDRVLSMITVGVLEIRLRTNKLNRFCFNLDLVFALTVFLKFLHFEELWKFCEKCGKS